MNKQVAFEIPKYLQFLLDNKFLGNKTKKGFYEKTAEKDASGRPVILALGFENFGIQSFSKSRYSKFKKCKAN